MADISSLVNGNKEIFFIDNNQIAVWITDSEGNVKKDGAKIDGEIRRIIVDGLGREKNEKAEIRGNEMKKGTARIYSGDGKVLQEMQYDNFNVNGFIKMYYPGGGLRLEGAYINGIGQWPMKTYFENGKLKTEKIYADNDKVQKTYFETG